MRERAEFRGDRDVIIRLGDDGGFARERIAHQRELVARAHQESEEAVEILERVIERDFERLAIREPPMQITARALGIAVALEMGTELFELATEHAGIRKRAVVDEAPVLARR